MRSAAERARVLTQRIITLGALLAGGALLFGLLGRDDATTETSAVDDDRGYYLADATMTELGADGRPRVVVRARSIEQQLSDQSVQMQTLELDYTTPKLGAWHVTADRGRMPSDRESIQLAGNVRVAGAATGTGGQAVILTDELAYDTRADVIQTSAPVAIEFGPHRLNGRGMRVRLNDGTLRLESNVHGRFTP